jgi:hypothetical protein
VRITPALSAQRNQTKITSVNAGNTPAISAGQNACGYYFVDVEIAAGGRRR